MNKLINLIAAATLLCSCEGKKERPEIVEAKRYANLIHRILETHCKIENRRLTGEGARVIEVLGKEDKLTFGIKGNPGKPSGGWILKSTINEISSNGKPSESKIEIQDWNGDGIPEHTKTTNTTTGETYYFTEKDYLKYLPEGALQKTKMTYERVFNLICQEEGTIHKGK